MRCVHCGTTRREVSLWDHIVAIAPLVVCCLTEELEW